MKPRIFFILSVFLALGVILSGTVLAKEDPAAKRSGKTQSPLGVTGTPTYGMININNWELWLESNGRSGYNPFRSGDGGIYPKGTSWVIFQDGFIFGAKLIDSRTGLPPASEPIRVGGQTYNQGMVAGAAPGGNPENPDAPDVRLYRIRRDYTDPTTDLREDAANFYQKNINAVTDADVAALKALYDKDWREWPVQKGAPYIDRNKNGRYDAPPAGTSAADLIARGLDEPGVAGADPNSPADQVMWTVCNDFNDAASRGLYGSPPTGIELQITAWGYKTTGPLGSVLFKKFRAINRGFFRSDSMFFAQWSDPDLGDFGDDFVGCDTVLSMGYVYNSNTNDRQYRQFGIPPPAGGYDFFQGPIVPGAATDVAIFDLKRRTGFRNLKMTSFNFFSAGSPISDPPQRLYEGTLRWWKMLRGFVADESTRPDRRFVDNVGRETIFPLAGDPVAKTGWYDGLPPALPPGDRRMALQTGPFKIAPGDTQEVVVGVIGGLGADRLSSVSVMKFHDRFAQNAYDALFAVPTPPPSPSVVVRELDGQVVLDWGSDRSTVTSIEQVERSGYVFQGYNVYQFPARTSTLTDGIKLATFDVIDEVTVVLDDQFDPKSGQILRLPVQIGANSGIQRFYQVSSDAVTGRPALRNGQEYYFGVTAYVVARDPAATPISLESAPRILPAIPQSAKPGIRYDAKYGDPLTVTHPAGKSAGKVTATVIDPGKATGQKYSVTFREGAGGVLLWDLKRAGTTLFSSSNQGPIVSGKLEDSFTYPTVDGLYVTVTGAPEGVKGSDMFETEDRTQWGWDIPAGTRRWTWAGGADGLGFEGFRGAIGFTEPSYYFGIRPTKTLKGGELVDVLLKYAATNTAGDVTNPNDPNRSFAYRYLRGATAAPARPEFAPFIKNPTGGYAFQEYLRSVPLAAFDTDVSPPRRLMVGHLENNVPGGAVNGKYWPPDFNVGNNVSSAGPREWLYIFKTSYSETADPTLARDILNNGMPVMYWIAAARRGDVAFAAGDEFAIFPNRPNSTADVFEFTAPKAAVINNDLAKDDVKKIQVWPNPYYAFNSAETNRFVRFVTFNFLPKKATVRIFNVAGQLVRILEKDDASQFLRWDLNNQSNFPVASGMYIAHIDMPDLNETKILKFAVIQEQEILEVF